MALTQQATDPVVQQPDPDHLGPDVAILIQPVYQIMPGLDNICWLLWPYRLGGGCSSLSVGHTRAFLLEGLMKVV